MKRESLFFIASRQIEVCPTDFVEPTAGQVVVQTEISAISPGTEMLIYRGEFPAGLSVDASIAGLGEEFSYPLKYGYSAVGRVVDVGAGVGAEWLDRPVFAFQPHETVFTLDVDQLIPIPDGISPEDAVFIPNMETAVNFIMDGKPLLGEQVVVFGAGIVGLLTTALLARYPLRTLISVDKFTKRREAAMGIGAHKSFSPDEDLQGQLLAEGYMGSDLTYELSGSPKALDLAIELTGFNGRVVIGSWYGQKRADLNLGGAFHRSRIQLISSQVSTLTPELSGRWNKARRFALAWEMIRQIRPSQFITQRVPFQEAKQAYEVVDQQPEQTIQVIFTY